MTRCCHLQDWNGTALAVPFFPDSTRSPQDLRLPRSREDHHRPARPLHCSRWPVHHGPPNDRMNCNKGPSDNSVSPLAGKSSPESKVATRHGQPDSNVKKYPTSDLSWATGSDALNPHRRAERSQIDEVSPPVTSCDILPITGWLARRHEGNKPPRSQIPLATPAWLTSQPLPRAVTYDCPSIRQVEPRRDLVSADERGVPYLSSRLGILA